MSAAAVSTDSNRLFVTAEEIRIATPGELDKDHSQPVRWPGHGCATYVPCALALMLNNGHSRGIELARDPDIRRSATDREVSS